MSSSEQFATIELVINDGPAQRALKEVKEAFRKYSPYYAADALAECLAREDGLECAPDLVDELEEALNRWFTPQPHQKVAFKTDMKRWFEYMRAFLELERLDGARGIMGFFHDMFHPDGKKICGSVRSRCVQAGKMDGKCIHKFRKGEYVCPDCDSPRMLCKKLPLQNGRCGKSGVAKGHGGQAPTGALAARHKDGLRRSGSGRGNMFAQKLAGVPDIQAMFLEALEDEDYIALYAEMALLSARRGELLQQLENLDLEEIADNIKRHVSSMTRAIGKLEWSDATYHAQEIESALSSGTDNRARWREIVTISVQMAKLADSERKRIVDAKRAVPIEDVWRLRDETIRAVRTAVSIGSEALYGEIMLAHEKGILGNLKVDNIRTTIMRAVADQFRPSEEEYAQRDATTIIEEEE